MVEGSLDAVEDNARASGDVYREERRTGWLKEAAGTARFTSPGVNRTEVRGAGDIEETIDTDRYGEIVCGYLAVRPITRRLPRVVSPRPLSLYLSIYLSLSLSLRRIVTGARWEASRADDYDVSEFYEARKKGPRFRSRGV